MDLLSVRLKSLPRETLEGLLAEIVALCYPGGSGGNRYDDPDVEIDGGDLVAGLTRLLDDYGLTPEKAG